MPSVEHTNRKHAILSASGSARWLACTASPRLESRARDKGSDYAREGTLAHELADLYLTHYIKRTVDGPRYKQDVGDIEKHELYSKSMPRYVKVYTDFVLERWSYFLGNTEGPQIFIEQKVDFSEYVPGGFGTGDATLVGGDRLELIDLKYGQGVRVDAVENTQLMLYGLGALYEFDLEYDIKKVSLTIVQPRLHSVSTYEISSEDLREWGRDFVRPRAKKAFEGKGETVAGDHCRFCKAKPTCKAYHELSLSLAREQFAFADPDIMTEEQMMGVYNMVPILTDWAKTVSDYIYERARKGDPPEGYKLVAGKGRRKWSDPEAVKEALLSHGYSIDDVSANKLLGIGDISSLMSKDDFELLLGPLIVKSTGSPLLVPVEDKRPALGEEDARLDFKDLIEIVK